APPYADAADFAADIRVIMPSLERHHAAALAHTRVAALARATDDFRFHLASLDLRQSSVIHEADISELLATAGVEANYAALPEADKLALLLRELAQPRLLTSPFITYSAQTTSELSILRTVREARKRHGAALARNYIISHTETLSDLVEV